MLLNYLINPLAHLLNKVLDMITQNIPLKQLRTVAVENGMVPLHIDGVQKVKAGITTIDEILRVANVSE